VDFKCSWSLSASDPLRGPRRQATVREERRAERARGGGTRRVGAKATLQIATKNGRRASRNAEERGSGSAGGGKNDTGGAESDHHDDGEEAAAAG
jgi:hypothetical protein